MYGCESWTAEKAECWRVDAFELWCWGILLRVPWTSRRSSQSILKEISPEYSLKDWGWSRSSNTLVTWCEELTYWKRPLCWEGLKAGREGDDRGWDGWMASPTLWTWIWVNSRSWWWTGKPGMLQSLGLQSDRTEQLNWTEIKETFGFQGFRLFLKNHGSSWRFKQNNDRRKTCFRNPIWFLMSQIGLHNGLQQKFLGLLHCRWILY